MAEFKLYAATVSWDEHSVVLPDKVTIENHLGETIKLTTGQSFAVWLGLRDYLKTHGGWGVD